MGFLHVYKFKFLTEIHIVSAAFVTIVPKIMGNIRRGVIHNSLNRLRHGKRRQSFTGIFVQLNSIIRILQSFQQQIYAAISFLLRTNLSVALNEISCG